MHHHLLKLKELIREEIRKIHEVEVQSDYASKYQNLQDMVRDQLNGWAREPSEFESPEDIMAELQKLMPQLIPANDQNAYSAALQVVNKWWEQGKRSITHTQSA